MSYSEQLLGQVSPFVDASVHRDKAVHSRFVPHVWIVEACVQHNDGKRQHITRVWEQETEMAENIVRMEQPQPHHAAAL